MNLLMATQQKVRARSEHPMINIYVIIREDSLNTVGPLNPRQVICSVSLDNHTRALLP